MKKFNTWRYLISALAIAVLAQFIYAGIDPLLGMDFYVNPQYKFVWSKIMMPVFGPPPTSFFYVSAAFTLVSALVFTFFYTVIKKGLPGKCLTCKGLTYGLLMFLAASIPGYLMMILLINLPLGLLAIWAAEELVIKILAGLIIADINK